VPFSFSSLCQIDYVRPIVQSPGQRSYTRE
jgi:hypothetical protein